MSTPNPRNLPRFQGMKRVPAMPECTNCGDCCGPVTTTAEEFIAIRDWMQEHGVEWVEQPNPITCGFYQGGKCAIYPVRPALCKLFGVVDAGHLTCSFFPRAPRLHMDGEEIVRRRLVTPYDRLLSEHFASDGGERQKTAALRVFVGQGQMRSELADALFGKTPDERTDAFAPGASAMRKAYQWPK